MIRSLLVATLLLAAPLAAAQPAANVWPLVPGNVWTFAMSERVGDGPPRRTQIVTWTALDSVDVPAGRFPRLRISAGETYDCIVTSSVTDGVAGFSLRTVAGDAPCAVPARLVPGRAAATERAFAMPVLPGLYDVFVGGETVPQALIRYGYATTPGCSYCDQDHWQTADGLGVWTFLHSRVLPSSASVEGDLRLAVIGGRSVGLPFGSRADFFPLATGNEWQFALSQRGTPAGVVAWTIVASEAGPVLRLRYLRSGTVEAEAMCAARVTSGTAETAWVTRFDFSACVLPHPALAPSSGGRGRVIYVDLYRPAALTVGVQSVQGDLAEDEPLWPEEASFVRGLGPYAYTSPHPVSGGRGWTAQLAFARVGSTTYGQQVVADESGPAPAALALTAGPNPTRGALALSFTLPTPTEATVEIVDALGRSVLWQALGAQPAGAGSARLDLSGLAAGVYSVRLAAGGAVQASVRVSVVR